MNIIILILALLVSVISSIIKAVNKRKAAQNMEHHPNPYPENPWQDIEGEVGQNNVPQQMRDYIEYKEPLDTEAGLSVREMAVQVKQPSKTRIEVVNEPEEVAANETSTSILNTFDLEKAVIFSEILKPKFDE